MKLDVVIIPFDSLPCSCEKFTINGMDADVSDFGSTVDMDEENAEEYGCGDRQFVPQMPTNKVLNKYEIDVDEYAEICDKLQCALAVGSCGWCI